MAFTKTASTANNNTPTFSKKVDWDAFNRHVEEKILGATDNGSSTNQVCFISGIVDTGIQPSANPYTEYDLADPIKDKVNYEKQERLLAKDFGCIKDEEKGKFYIPKKPSDSILMFVDFPDIMIDYGKFFGEGSELKPYRTLLLGEWDRVAQVATLNPDKTNGYYHTSVIYKVAKAAGLFKDKLPADFDLGKLLGAVFTVDITVKRGGNEGQFLNVRVNNVASKHKAIPVPEHNVVPFGISMDGGNDEEALKQIYLKSAVIKRLEMAQGWESSGLKKEIDALLAKDSNQQSEQKEPTSDQPEPEEKQEETSPEGVDDNFFDDDIPF